MPELISSEHMGHTGDEYDTIPLDPRAPIPEHCRECGCALAGHQKSWSRCDGCFEAGKLARDASRRLAGESHLGTKTGRLASSPNLQNLPRTMDYSVIELRAITAELLKGKR